MNSSAISNEELDEKISLFIKRKSNQYPELDLQQKKQAAFTLKKNVYFDALNSLIKLVYEASASTKQARL